MWKSISKRDHSKSFIFRTREFEQIEISISVSLEPMRHSSRHGSPMKINSSRRLSDSKERESPIHASQRAPHYSRRAGGFRVSFPFGWGEISTLANRTDYDLKAHMEPRSKISRTSIHSIIRNMSPTSSSRLSDSLASPSRRSVTPMMKSQEKREHRGDHAVHHRSLRSKSEYSRL